MAECHIRTVGKCDCSCLRVYGRQSIVLARLLNRESLKFLGNFIRKTSKIDCFSRFNQNTRHFLSPQKNSKRRHIRMRTYIPTPLNSSHGGY